MIESGFEERGQGAGFKCHIAATTSWRNRPVHPTWYPFQQGLFPEMPRSVLCSVWPPCVALIQPQRRLCLRSLAGHGPGRERFVLSDDDGCTPRACNSVIFRQAWPKTAPGRRPSVVGWRRPGQHPAWRQRRGSPVAMNFSWGNSFSRPGTSICQSRIPTTGPMRAGSMAGSASFRTPIGNSSSY